MKMLYLAAIAAAALGLWGCGADGHDHDHEHGHEGEAAHEAEAEEHHHGDEIILSPEMAQRMGVETAALEPSAFHEVIKTGGQVMPAPQDVAVAVAPAAGTVSFAGGITAGSTVGAGAVIARVSSAGMTSDASRAAKAELDAAKAELDRATPLYEQNIITARDYNEIKARYEAALAAYNPSASSGSVTSPIAGVITSVLARQGEYVEAGQPIAQISKTSRLTLRADLPERYYASLPGVKSANFRPAHSDKTLSLSDLGGSLSGSASMASAQGGYIPLYFTFTNDGSVAPGAYVDVYLLGQPRQGALVIPIEAVTEQQGEYYAYVQIDDEGYERRLVTLGGNDGQRVEVLSGLNPGENVVVKGATVVRLAENSGSVPEGHSHNH